jgi:hypothetical protein
MTLEHAPHAEPLRFAFRGGKLCIMSPTVEIAVKGWPDPESFVNPHEGGWRPFRPEFRLLRPGEAEEELADTAGTEIEEQLFDEKVGAFNSFRSSVPLEVAAAVERFQGHQWALLALLNRGQKAFDLVRYNPALAYCLANNDEFRKLVRPDPAEQACRLIDRRQRVILAIQVHLAQHIHQWRWSARRTNL